MPLSLVVFAGALALPGPGRIEGVAICRLDNPNENIVVILTADRLKTPDPPEIPVVLDQRNLRFLPHVLPILRGTTVAFPNSDPIRHNVFSASEAQMFNLGTYSSGITRAVTFGKPGVVELLCNVHPEMSAYILVLETPYFKSTDGRGFFQFDEIDPGNYTLSFWCEHRGFISRRVSVDSVQTIVIEAVLHDDEVKLAGREIPAIAGER
jgi:plastocyanin